MHTSPPRFFAILVGSLVQWIVFVVNAPEYHAMTIYSALVEGVVIGCIASVSMWAANRLLPGGILHIIPAVLWMWFGMALVEVGGYVPASHLFAASIKEATHIGIVYLAYWGYKRKYSST
jgi:hypothetical protein